MVIKILIMKINSISLGISLAASALLVVILSSAQGEQENLKSDQSVKSWEKHTILEKGKRMIFSSTAADFTGDGLVDVISSYQGKVILFKAPDWKQQVIHEFDTPRDFSIASLAIDIDSDGDLDFVGGAAHKDPIWLENKHQTSDTDEKPWACRIIDTEVRGIHSIISADVNKDGRLDLIVNNFKPEGLLSNSAMWYEIPLKPLSNTPWIRNIFADKDAAGGSHYFGFGDVDGDGWGEIALAAKGKPFENGNWFAYWKNPTGKNTKDPWKKVDLLNNREGATNILITDVNADNKNDFVISHGHGEGIFWLQAPDYQIHTIDDKMICPHSLTKADFDQDGDIDIASCGFKSKRLSLYFNDGKGLFQRVDIDNDQESYDLKCIDIDLDGDLDILNSGRGSGNVSWYENPTNTQ